MLGGGEDVRLGRVHHHDAAVGGRRGVDVVEADAGAPHDHEIGGGGEDLGGHLRGRPDDQCVRASDRVAQLLGVEPLLHVDGVPRVAETVEAAVSDGFGDEDAGHRGPILTGRARGRQLKRP